MFYKKTKNSIIVIECELFLIAGFNIEANIVATRHGFPRIEYNGYSFGFKRGKDGGQITTWMCTKNLKKRRCTATVDTKYINGIMMLKVLNPKYLCDMDFIPKCQRVHSFAIN